ncbi:hypothetical protein BDW22DRAFT_1432508 [Trametopsis cervina]|nr:hypothetical protein BDW22DRAFT_1432508 [Trametopsis cervina]
MSTRTKRSAKRTASVSPPEGGDVKRQRNDDSVVRAVDSTVTWVAQKFFVPGSSATPDEEGSLTEPSEEGPLSQDLESTTGATSVVATAEPTIEDGHIEVRAVMGQLSGNEVSDGAGSNTAEVGVKDLEKPSKKTGDEEFKFASTVTIKQARLFASAAEAVDVERHVYPLSGVPESVEWGKRGPDVSRFLCIGDATVTVKVVGRVTSLYFYDRGGQPVERVSVGIRPLRERDVEAAGKYLQAFSSNKRSMPDSDDFTLYASRFCTKPLRGHTRPQVYMFDNLWDASKCTDSLSSRTKLDGPENITINDVVMLEMRLVRWKNTNGGPAAGWTSFTAGFQLEGISLLVEDEPIEATGSSSYGYSCAF